MRVFELAKKLKVSSKELLSRLRELKIDVTSHMARLEENDITKVKKSLAPKKKAVRKKAEPKKPTKKPVKKVTTRKKKATTAKTKARTKATTKTTRTRTPTKKRTATTRRARKKELPKAQEKQAAAAVGQAVAVEERPAAREPAVREVPPKKKPVEIDETTTVGEFAQKLGVGLDELILELMDYNVLASKNQNLDFLIAKEVALGHGCTVRITTPEEEIFLEEKEDDPALLKPRAPVVTLMGHVDHGKTSLLDVIRKSNVVAGESGGITQHIGAYEVATGHGRVVFLDTPGHEAFTAMRARGAEVTDIAVLVVAADDGVMPQTVEAVNHARAADVPVVVAINKIDKTDAGPDKVRQQLMQLGLVHERWGGHTTMIEVSAKTGQGIEELIEMLLIEGEMLELKANPEKRARGVVLEAKLDKGRGCVATVVVKAGTIRIGDPFVAGLQYGKVRALFNDRGANLDESGPSTAVEVVGFAGLPEAGDLLISVADERKARQISQRRKLRQRERMAAPPRHVTLDDLYARVQEGQLAQLNVIIKGDVHGSVDVLNSALQKLSADEVKLDVLHNAVGGINESDVLLASASDAVIIGYHVVANPEAKKMAEDHGVDVRTYNVIYEAVDAVKAAMEGLLEPEYREEATGRVEVRQVFNISGVGTVAGSYVLEGEVARGQQARLVRDGVIAHEGKIGTLRRFKQDVKSVQSGYECGLTLENFGDIHVNDVVEAYKTIEIERKL
jgi:translation initiation factor IF-2